MVPKAAITMVANTFYGEHYETLPMRHQWLRDPLTQTIAYRWQKNNKWNHVKVETEYPLLPILEGSEVEFITEHYWGYTKINDHKTSEYGVEHPRWAIYKTKSFEVNVDFTANYGENFSFLQKQEPSSVFVAEGSFIEVKKGKMLL